MTKKNAILRCAQSRAQWLRATCVCNVVSFLVIDNKFGFGHEVLRGE